MRLAPQRVAVANYAATSGARPRSHAAAGTALASLPRDCAVRTLTNAASRNRRVEVRYAGSLKAVALHEGAHLLQLQVYPSGLAKLTAYADRMSEKMGAKRTVGVWKHPAPEPASAGIDHRVHGARQ